MLGISLVPEGRRVFPSLTVHENLQVGAHARRTGPWNTDKVYELFPLLDAPRAAPGLELSGGEQQALAIGRGLMANPRLLLLDEVSLGLAPVVVQELYQAMPAIVGSGTTVLLVEQDVGQAMKLPTTSPACSRGASSSRARPASSPRKQIFAAYFGV